MPLRWEGFEPGVKNVQLGLQLTDTETCDDVQTHEEVNHKKTTGKANEMNLRISDNR